ncbi:PEP-CTERM sorting domain-containing protein [Paludisphaera soli]|uniref:PEP-CTERM sorting domain-containing protein n=1 Tax=Paludisphaera soli TaxID=2712865 RepID=UPI0013ECBD1C
MAAIPEPSSITLGALGAVGLIGYGCGRRRPVAAKPTCLVSWRVSRLVGQA